MTDEVDALVREHLRALEEKVDAPRLLARVRARLRARPLAVGERWGLAAAAAILLVILLTLQGGPAQASPQALVREAQRVHALPKDRCYHVRLELDPAVQEKFPLLAAQHEMRLWTRGDCFWMAPSRPGQSWAWGRDEAGRVWLAINSQRGVQFDADELPPPLALACDVRSVRMETLLQQVLKDFVLTEEPAAEAGVSTILAVPRPGQPKATIRSARIEIDRRTKQVRRLVLHRAVAGRPLGSVDFTLAETAPQPDQEYRLQGHLQPGATVFSRTHEPLRRFPLVLQQLGQVIRQRGS